MPYMRRSNIPDNRTLVKQVEKAIRALTNKFREHPYTFYTETDMHCYLYHRLYKGGLINGLYRTAEGHDTILLHKEYPTAAQYKKGEGRVLSSVEAAGSRGHFDICIWNPEWVSTQKHRQQRVLVAVELALNECGKNNVHTLNDAIKLTDAKNGVRFGYILYYVRDCNAYFDYSSRIEKELNDASGRIRVMFAHVDRSRGISVKRELGEWGGA